MRTPPHPTTDLSGGGLFLITSAFLCYALAFAVPIWWFTTTELQGEMCACGTGLWDANVTWGDDLALPGMYEPLVCSKDNPIMTNRCDAPWDRVGEARDAGKVAGAVTALSICLAFGAMVFGWRHVPGHGDPVNARRAAWLSLFACATQLTAVCIFTASPLFDDLDALFGCAFVFHHALNSNYLTCHALGPGWALSAVGVIFAAVAAILFYFAFRPTSYTAPESGRYSLFTEMFERHVDQPLLMAADELYPVVDTAGPMRRFVRAFGVPMLCMGNLALFLYSNMSTGATVEPHVAIKFPPWLAVVVKQIVPLAPDNMLEFRDDVFNFTLVSSLRHFWSARAYALAFLIGAFSGVWPYAKIFAMMMMWFCPASERVRGRGLHWIDVLGKWSLIDAYVLSLMAVGFGFNTDADILGIAIHVDIEVQPGWGVYSFILATIWSLALSHYLTHLHRQAVERRTWTAEFLKSMRKPPHETLASRSFAPVARHRRFKCVLVGRVLVWTLLVLTFAITLAGQIAPTFRFAFSGLAELILPPEKLVNDYSLVRVGEDLPHAARHGGYLAGTPWNYFLTLEFFALAMVIPLLRVVFLMVLWSVPMTLKTSRRLLSFVEVIAAWSALDVFLVSIMAAVLEIGALSQEVISSAFGSLEATVCELLGSLPPAVLDAVLHAVGLPSLDLSRGCALFRVDAELSEGCWLLLAAVLACEVCSHVVTEFAEAAIAERMAMLSAYHRVRGRSPSRNPRDNAAAAAAEAAAAAADQQRVMLLFTPDSNTGETRPPVPPASRQLRRLLSAQEYGSASFVGAWADIFYGPFPRPVWKYLVGCGCMRRVEWEEIGSDLREDLVVADTPRGSQLEESFTASSLPYQGSSSSRPVPLPPRSAATLAHTTSSHEEDIRTRLLSSSPAWTPDSPMV